MDAKKYSTGTKGRLQMHRDLCKEVIHSHSPNFHLATEYIDSLDPEKDDRVWQRFQSPEDILPYFRAWLDGEEIPLPAPGSQKPAGLQPAVHTMKPSPDEKATQAFEKTLAWLKDAPTAARIGSMAAEDVATLVMRKFYLELTGREVPSNE